MARKRREPPPPPPQEESSAESSSDEEEEEAQGTLAIQRPPQNPKPPYAAAPDDADADSSEGGDEEQEAEDSSESEVDAQVFQLRQVARSPRKPPASFSKPESDADEEEEDGDSSEPEPANLEPVQKKEEKKRPAPEPILPAKAKKAKAEVEKAAPEPTPSSKATKAKAGAEKVARESIPASKAKKPRPAPEKAAPDPSPSSKSEKPTRWKTKDEIKILGAIVAHVKNQGVYPRADDLIAAVGESLDRKDCSRTGMYEKVRRLKQRYEVTTKKVASTGALPDKDDDLRIYKLSETVWGENAKEVASASISRNNGALSKSKKVRTIANENGDSLTGSKRGQASKEKIDEDTKTKSSKQATTTTTPAESKKWGNHKEEMGEDAKSGTSKRGEADKEKMDGDTESVMPKEDTTATQNGGTPAKRKKGEIQKEETDRDANVQGIHKDFDELQSLYPNLAFYVERIEAQHPCGETLKRAFEFIGDEKAHALESKIKKQNVAEVKMQIRRADTKEEVANMLIGLLD